MAKPKIDLLIEVYDQAYNVRAWHGTNLRGALKGLKLDLLLYRPKPKRHNIWEVALHCAYWKYAVCRKLIGGDKGSFPRKPSDWPKYSKSPSMDEWRSDLKLLEEQHNLLRQAILEFPENKLYKCPAKSKVNYISNIYGASSHDLYHAGQIQLLKRMFKNK